MPKYPLIECHVAIGGGRGEKQSVVPKFGLPLVLHEDGSTSIDPADRRITPAEAILLLHMNGWDGDPATEGMIIRNARITGTLEIDAQSLRVDMVNRYGRDRVNQLFPVGLPVECDYPDARQPAVDEMTRRNELKKTYAEITGKKPFGGWNEEQLEEQIAKARQNEPAAA